MTRLTDKSGSQDIAAHFAELRRGDMAQIPDDTPCGIGWGWLTAWGAAFLLVGLIAGYAFGKVPEYVPTEQFINCYSEGC